MTACTSLRSTSRSTPLTIGVPSSRATCTFSSFSNPTKSSPSLGNCWLLPSTNSYPSLAEDPRPGTVRNRQLNGSCDESKTRYADFHARLDLSVGAAAPCTRRPPRLRTEAAAGDGPVAGQGDARVQDR